MGAGPERGEMTAFGELRYDRGGRGPHDRIEVGAVAVAIERLQGGG